MPASSLPSTQACQPEERNPRGNWGTRKLSPVERALGHLAVECSHPGPRAGIVGGERGQRAEPSALAKCARGHRERRALPAAAWPVAAPVGPLLGISQGATRADPPRVGAWAEGPSRWLFPHLPVVPALQAHPTPCHTGMGALGKSVSPSQSPAWGISSAAGGCVLSDEGRRARAGLAATGGQPWTKRLTPGQGQAWPPGLRPQRLHSASWGPETGWAGPQTLLPSPRGLRNQ